MTIEEKFNSIPQEKFPNHIAIIPNGNRTWAKKHGTTVQEGHNAGVEVLIKFARVIRQWGIHTGTVWGSSTENVSKRDPKEIANLFLNPFPNPKSKKVNQDKTEVKVNQTPYSN